MTLSLHDVIPRAVIRTDTMTTASTTKPRRETLNLRIPALERQLIDRAAESTGRTRTDFIPSAAPLRRRGWTAR